MGTYIEPRCYLNNIHALLWLKPCCVCPFASVFARVRQVDNQESYSPSSTRLTSPHLLSHFLALALTLCLCMSMSMSLSALLSALSQSRT